MKKSKQWQKWANKWQVIASFQHVCWLSHTEWRQSWKWVYETRPSVDTSREPRLRNGGREVPNRASVRQQASLHWLTPAQRCENMTSELTGSRAQSTLPEPSRSKIKQHSATEADQKWPEMVVMRPGLNDHHMQEKWTARWRVPKLESVRIKPQFYSQKAREFRPE